MEPSECVLTPSVELESSASNAEVVLRELEFEVSDDSAMSRSCRTQQFPPARYTRSRSPHVLGFN